MRREAGTTLRGAAPQHKLGRPLRSSYTLRRARGGAREGKRGCAAPTQKLGQKIDAFRQPPTAPVAPPCTPQPALYDRNGRCRGRGGSEGAEARAAARSRSSEAAVRRQEQLLTSGWPALLVRHARRSRGRRRTRSDTRAAAAQAERAPAGRHDRTRRRASPGVQTPRRRRSRIAQALNSARPTPSPTWTPARDQQRRRLHTRGRAQSTAQRDAAAPKFKFRENRWTAAGYLFVPAQQANSDRADATG